MKLLSALFTFLLLSGCGNEKAENSYVSRKSAFSENKGRVWGNRFIITGDFDGDSKTDTLREQYLSRVTVGETYKFDTLLEYEDQILRARRDDCYAVLSGQGIPDFEPVVTGNGTFGFVDVRNEGDLNNDGRDELSYVLDKAHFSVMNSCKIITLKNGKWQELYSFPTRETELATLDGSFKPLVRKLKNNRALVYFINDEAESDSVVIHLK